ncbi:hypothetical protein [Ruficoccus sp. ZRK36]|uniref:hypothetical protein n=1 Tax=Ruficoccus sp. ZRK36 TaxID=2866311 RepID=UPI001C72AC35|nr:hypothetical protein [Ruficoccus sp. ZRK36]QYY36637.1 hypothetical protein K0V07_03985 [Ruficoccus sp. ZRK36]
MNKSYSAAFLFALASPVCAEIQTWQFAGELNYVSTSLQSSFSAGDTFSISMDVDTSVEPSNAFPLSFYTTTGSYRGAVSNGEVTVDGWYSAEFQSVSPTTGSISIINATSDAPSGNYDQLTMSFSSGVEGAVVAPDVSGNEVMSIEFNFTDEDQPYDMILGNNASYPDANIAFPVPGETFFPEKATNGTYAFIIRFSGNSGADMIRGSLTLVPEPSDGIWLMGAAGLGALTYRRIRSNAQRKAA